MGTLQYINTNLSGVLSAVIALITALITLVYVVFTYKQMKATQNATDTAIKQLQLNNQPCVIAEIFRTYGGKCFSGTRRQLHIDVELENVGDSPALTTYTFAYLELQNTKHVKNGSNIVDMDYLPDFIKCIKANEEKKLLYALKLYRPHYRGTVLVIEVYFRNVLGQWFKNTVRQEIAWLIDKHAEPRKTHNINENTIPPRPLGQNTEVELQLVSPKMSVFQTDLIEAKVIEEKLLQYKDDLKY